MVALVILISAIVLASTGLGLGGTGCHQGSDRFSLCHVTVTLIMSAIGSSWWLLFVEPQFMQDLARLTIMAWAMDGFYDLLYFDMGLSGTMEEAKVLLLMTVIFFGVAISRFRFE